MTIATPLHVRKSEKNNAPRGALFVGVGALLFYQTQPVGLGMPA